MSDESPAGGRPLTGRQLTVRDASIPRQAGASDRTTSQLPRSVGVATHAEPLPGSALGWAFVARYAAAYMGAILMLIAPMLVTLALKLDALVGDRAPDSLALVAGMGALVAMVGNPLFGRLSDRTTSRFGQRRPWLVVGLLGGSTGTLVVALAPTVGVVLLGWCLAQLFFNAVLAALLAVLPDQVPTAKRGLVSGVLGMCLPVASVCGTFVVDLVNGHLVAMFMAPCVVGGALILWFAAGLDDRRLDPADRSAWSWGELARTFYVRPRTSGDFLWAFSSRFLFVLAYAFLTSYEAFYLLDHLGSSEDVVAGQVLLATLLQSALVIAASVSGGPLSDRTGRRKAFVFAASAVFGVAMFVLALATELNGFYMALAISGIGLGLYVAVDLALVVDVLPDPGTAAKDLGVFNIAGALPYSLAPAVAPAVLALGGYSGLYLVAGLCALTGAAAILPVRQVR